MNTFNLNKKQFLLLAIISIGALSSCGNADGTAGTSPTDSTDMMKTVKDTTLTVPSADTAISYPQLKVYLPSAIPGYKTIGYPDTADRFTGEPTGETHSSRASGGPISFAKHLFKQNEVEIGIEIIDYKPALETFKGLYRMYDFEHMQHTEQEEAKLVETKLPGVKAKQVFNKEAKTSTIHAFVCDRFLVNVQVVNTTRPDAAKDALKFVRLEYLINDYCSK